MRNYLQSGFLYKDKKEYKNNLNYSTEGEARGLNHFNFLSSVPGHLLK